jgi:hypothetical protein
MRKTVLLLILLPALARAEPPPGADPNSATARWVHTLKDHRGWGCCDLADCRPTVMRLDDEGHVRVWIGKDQYGPGAPDAWEPVTAEVLEGTTASGPAPDAHTWACWYNGKVQCLLPGGGL